MGQSTSTASFGKPITGSSHQEKVRVREQWKGGPNKELRVMLGPAVSSPTRTLFPQGYWTQEAETAPSMALHMASSDLDPGGRWGWRQTLLYCHSGFDAQTWAQMEPLGRGCIVGGEIPGGATPGNWSSLVHSGPWQIRSLQKVHNLLLVKGVLTCSVFILLSEHLCNS